MVDKKNQQKANVIFSKETGILPKIPKQERYNLLGQIASLMLSSNLHRRYIIDDIGIMFLPAIHLNQFRIYRNKEGDPVALVTWGFLSDKIEKEFQEGTRLLKLEDWNSGKNGWVMDFIAPFGHAKQVIKDLRENIFPDREGKALRLTKDGKVRGVWKLNNLRKKNNNK